LAGVSQGIDRVHREIGKLNPDTLKGYQLLSGAGEKTGRPS
jgi:hypothetical protein